MSDSRTITSFTPKTRYEASIEVLSTVARGKLVVSPSSLEYLQHRDKTGDQDAGVDRFDEACAESQPDEKHWLDTLQEHPYYNLKGKGKLGRVEAWNIKRRRRDLIILSRCGDRAITFLRVLDLVLVSHTSSHVGDFDSWISKSASSTPRFIISSQSCAIITNSVPLDKFTTQLSRRTLKCLNGFLSGKKVWVLHGPGMDPDDLTDLYLSTAPDDFANVWGPMWKITNVGSPKETLRYDFEHGSVVPISVQSESCGQTPIAVSAEPDEELCHWIPVKALEEFERSFANTPLPLPVTY